jgi:hypothetical protein
MFFCSGVPGFPQNSTVMFQTVKKWSMCVDGRTRFVIQDFGKPEHGCRDLYTYRRGTFSLECERHTISVVRRPLPMRVVQYALNVRHLVLQTRWLSPSHSRGFSKYPITFIPHKLWTSKYTSELCRDGVSFLCLSLPQSSMPFSAVFPVIQGLQNYPAVQPRSQKKVSHGWAPKLEATPLRD